MIFQNYGLNEVNNNNNDNVIYKDIFHIITYCHSLPFYILHCLLQEV